MDSAEKKPKCEPKKEEGDLIEPALIQVVELQLKDEDIPKQEPKQEPKHEPEPEEAAQDDLQAAPAPAPSPAPVPVIEEEDEEDEEEPPASQGPQVAGIAAAAPGPAPEAQAEGPAPAPPSPPPPNTEWEEDDPFALGPRTSKSPPAKQAIYRSLQATASQQPRRKTHFYPSR